MRVATTILYPAAGASCCTSATSATPPSAIAAVIEYHELGATLGGIANAMEALGVTLPPGETGWYAEVVKGVLVEAGVLVETTGRKRDRIFFYNAYLDVLRAGTELEQG